MAGEVQEGEGGAVEGFLGGGGEGEGVGCVGEGGTVVFCFVGLVFLGGFGRFVFGRKGGGDVRSSRLQSERLT